MIDPVLSIIIVSYNTSKITHDCLRSIFSDTGLEFDLSSQSDKPKIPTEIIIIDNASSDDSVKMLQKQKHIRLISNSQNLGFAKANNQGIKIAKGNFILLLNSDTKILHSSISQSLSWLSAHPEAYACTAQLLNSNDTIQASGGYFPNLLNVCTWSLGLDDLPFINSLIKPIHPHTPHFYTKDRFYLNDHPQDWITGAFMLLRTSSLQKTTLFDESYFMYGEELELCYRIKKTNPKKSAWYLVGPQIIHLGGASSVSRLDPIVNEYRGILAFFKKHKSQSEYFLVRLLLKINAFLRSTIYLFTKNTQSSKLYFSACSKI